MHDLASIYAALGSAKTIVELVKNANDAQLTVKVASEVLNLQGKLMDVQQQALEIQTDNQQLRAEIEKFRSYVHHHSVTWRVRPDGTQDGPFCPICNGEGRDMRLSPLPHVDQSQVWMLWCPKGHVKSGERLHTGRAKVEPTYRVPKDQVAENYF
jgi:hypothetical protein